MHSKSQQLSAMLLEYMEGDTLLDDQPEEVAAFLNYFETDDKPNSIFERLINNLLKIANSCEKRSYLSHCMRRFVSERSSALYSHYQCLELPIIFCCIPGHQKVSVVWNVFERASRTQ